MTTTEIAALRLYNQQLSTKKINSPQALVQYMGAMQAQDAAMCKWAVGIRLEKASEAKVQEALDSGAIIRTHLMRPTWHLVAAEDLRWMLMLTAPQIKSSMKSRAKQLEIDEAVLKKTYKIFENALIETDLTREVLLSRLHEKGIATGDNRASHLLMYAELDGLICSGASQNGKQTYSLLEKLPETGTITREEAIEKLAVTYFTSHGPATLQDFAWWSGLPIREARQGIEALGRHFISEAFEGQNHWMKNSLKTPEIDSSMLLLPAFDEYLISYKDRSAVLEPLHHKKAVSINGIFNPVVVFEGHIIGTWKRSLSTEKVSVALLPFLPLNRKKLDQIEVKANEYAGFLGKNLVKSGW